MGGEAGGCAGACGVAWLAAGSWAGAGTDDCSATKAAAPSPNNVKRTSFTRCKNDLQVAIATRDLDLPHYLTVEKTRGQLLKEIHIRYANKELCLDRVFNN
jgi:hypothetical protein